MTLRSETTSRFDRRARMSQEDKAQLTGDQEDGNPNGHGRTRRNPRRSSRPAASKPLRYGWNGRRKAEPFGAQAVAEQGSVNFGGWATVSASSCS